MSKFGDLIDLEVPVLFNFYAEWNDASLSMTPVLKDVAAALGDRRTVLAMASGLRSRLSRNQQWQQTLAHNGRGIQQGYNRSSYTR